MPWFMYTGKVPVGIPVGDGEVICATPRIRFEAKFVNPDIRRLQKRGVLQVCGKPVGVKSIPLKPVEDIPIGDLVKTDFSQSIVERGKKSLEQAVTDARTSSLEFAETVKKSEKDDSVKEAVKERKTVNVAGTPFPARDESGPVFEESKKDYDVEEDSVEGDKKKRKIKRRSKSKKTR